MATEPITTRYEKLFDTIDNDYDGRVTQTDCQSLARRFADAYDLDHHGSRSRALVDAYNTFWNELAAESSTQMLSKEEFTQALATVASDASRLNRIEALPAALFDVADTDGDKELSMSELVKFAEAIRGDHTHVLDSFQKLSTDGNPVSREAVLQDFRDYLTSTDTKATAGGIILGAR
ncbi:hypothetical protein [Streptomyces sp. NPDC057889]|uniref:hypothetical protein n=1 Tax=unclassified Streptomyces TaxID=2593676 RepID=UPI0036C99BBA